MPIKPPTRLKRIDWSRIIFDLERAGMTQGEISVQAGIEHDNPGVWANRLKNIPGTQPKFHNGAMLLGLWAEVMDMEPAEAPKEA